MEDKSKSYKRKPYDDLKLTYIKILDFDFIFPEMKSNVSKYIINHPGNSLSVCFISENESSVEERALLSIKNIAKGGIFNRTKIALYIEPERISNAAYERFKIKMDLKDFIKNGMTYMAVYDKNVEKALKIATYILMSVYYISPDIKLEYVIGS